MGLFVSVLPLFSDMCFVCPCLCPPVYVFMHVCVYSIQAGLGAFISREGMSAVAGLG